MAMRTFQVKQNVVLIVLEHMRHKLNVHVLDIDFLQERSKQESVAFGRLVIGCGTCKLLFKTATASFSFSCGSVNSCQIIEAIAEERTTFVMILDSKMFCWCS